MTPGWYKRQRIWRHNGLFGSVKMASLAMETILILTTTTDESRQIAANIRPLLYDLAVSLKTRRPEK